MRKDGRLRGESARRNILQRGQQRFPSLRRRVRRTGRGKVRSDHRAEVIGRKSIVDPRVKRLRIATVDRFGKVVEGRGVGAVVREPERSGFQSDIGRSERPQSGSYRYRSVIGDERRRSTRRILSPKTRHQIYRSFGIKTIRRETGRFRFEDIRTSSRVVKSIEGCRAEDAAEFR